MPPESQLGSIKTTGTALDHNEFYNDDLPLLILQGTQGVFLVPKLVEDLKM